MLSIIGRNWVKMTTILTRLTDNQLQSIESTVYIKINEYSCQDMTKEVGSQDAVNYDAIRPKFTHAALIFNDSRVIHVAEKFKRLGDRIRTVFHQTFSIGFACISYNANSKSNPRERR